MIAKEHKLFYWRGKSSAELEFIIESDNKLYPIDVKKGRGTLNSLEKFAHHNKFEYAIKVSKNNYGYTTLALIVDDENKQFQLVSGQSLRTGKYPIKSKKELRFILEGFMVYCGY